MIAGSSVYKTTLYMVTAVVLIGGEAQAATRRPVQEPLISRSVFGPGLAKTPADSFNLYGGPGEVRGKFEDSLGDPDLQGWIGVDLTQAGSGPFFGDFSKVRENLTDLDDCVENDSPQLVFFDDGTPPNNGGVAPGSFSPPWTYGDALGHVINYTGGASSGTERLANEVWSPEVKWESTLPDDDGMKGLTIAFDVWRHLPYENGIYYYWSFRSLDMSTSTWSDWKDRDYSYWSQDAQYERRVLDVTDLLVDQPQKVQFRFGVVDNTLEEGVPGGAATPGPWFDNFSFIKHDAIGPKITARDIDLFHDAFIHGTAPLDPLNLGAAAIRLDMAQDIHHGPQVVPGDSIVVDVVPLPGTTLLGPPEMIFFLVTNPLFDGFRYLPPGTVLDAPRVYRGTVVGQPVTDRGAPVANRYFFDLPDGPPRNVLVIPEPTEPTMFFPGDKLIYVIEATDSNNHTSGFPTIAANLPPVIPVLCGDNEGKAEPRGGKPIPSAEPAGGLPEAWDEGPQRSIGPGVAVTRILVWDDAGDPDELEIFQRALREVGIREGRDYAVYSTLAPDAGVGNGLGASDGHGASAAQLADFDILFYLGGRQWVPLISDGSNFGGNDKSNDLGVIQSWLAQAGNRTVAYFADNIGTGLRAQGTPSQAYLSGTMGVQAFKNDTSSLLPSVATEVSSTHPVFPTQYVVYSGCSPTRQFDELVPLSGATAAHQYQPPGGPPTFAASVMKESPIIVNTVTYLRRQLTFPYAISRVYDRRNAGGQPNGEATRSALLGEILTWAGHPIFPADAVDGSVPVRLDFAMSAAHPNPFNPTTSFFVASTGARDVSIVVYDVQGRRVRSLFSGAIGAGSTRFRWNGQNDTGQSVASGQYFLEVTSRGQREVRRAVLLK